MKKVTAPPPGDRPLKTIDRIISKAGLGSRSDARRFVKERRVRVNGKIVADPDQWIDTELDEVTFDGQPLRHEERVYLALHKPTGYLTTYKHPSGRATVFDLLPPELGYVFPVGRLDLDTSGLLLLTNESSFAEEVMNPVFKVAKTYRVEAEGPLTRAQLAALGEGVMLDDGPTRPARVELIEEREGVTVIELAITEGRNRQVRRMLEAVGSKAITLARVAIGSLTMEGLEPGAHRRLSDADLARVRRN